MTPFPDPGSVSPPFPGEAPQVAYRQRSPDTWAAAREAYLAGWSADAVCDRFDLGLSALRARARREGWRRADQPDPAADLGEDLEDDDPAPAPAGDLAALAWTHLARALRRGRSAEAQRWLRVHALLTGPERQNLRREQTRRAGFDDGLTARLKAIGHVAQSIGMDPEAFRATDREVRARAAPTHPASPQDVHGVHRVHCDSDRAHSAVSDPVRPLSRAERRRLAKLGRASP